MWICISKLISLIIMWLCQMIYTYTWMFLSLWLCQNIHTCTWIFLLSCDFIKWFVYRFFYNHVTLPDFLFMYMDFFSSVRIKLKNSLCIDVFYSSLHKFLWQKIIQTFSHLFTYLFHIFISFPKAWYHEEYKRINFKKLLFNSAEDSKCKRNHQFYKNQFLLFYGLT